MEFPASTYRLQISESFDLDQVAGLAPYVHELGADWLYLSPLLRAEPGSDHGYDVIDHRLVDPVRGGAAGLQRAAAAAHGLGLGILVDIVPNHMGVATPQLNAWWWDILTYGTQSRFAAAFDIDWNAGKGRIQIPVLGDPVRAGDDALAELRIDSGMLAYFDHRYPIAPGTDDDGADARTVHSRQHYQLIHWRRADGELNYRRFFAVNSLAGIRVEVPWVFDATHAEIGRWFATGQADGVRVDHPDGLRDPRGYLARLAELTGGAYTLVEKILEPGERMPQDWATSGSTGYDALAEIDRVLIDPAGEAALSELDSAHWPELIHSTKRAVADGILHSEVLRVVRELGRAGDLEVTDAVAELLACFPVYRSYLPDGAEHAAAAAADAIRRRPLLAGVLASVAAELADPVHPAALRFQQTSGMVMAKGVEDCAFYRYSRLTSLNEVGGDPSRFCLDVAEFHRRQHDRLVSWPHSMTTLSTHDTKRGEDVRARIHVLAELPRLWADVLGRLRRWTSLGDPPLENLLWQAIVGSWPASRDRLHAYAVKAAREAGNSTGWADPDQEFEARMHAMIDAAFDDPRVAELLGRIFRRLRRPGFVNSLSAKLVQLTVPGVPDVYQGSELWEQSLVDPDNRRPVDFQVNRRLLAQLKAGLLPKIDDSAAAKLLVVWRALSLRRDRPELFGGYQGLVADGPAAQHALIFDRGGAITIATRLPVGLELAGGWADTSVEIPDGQYTEVLTGRGVCGGRAKLRELLARYPVALLARERAGQEGERRGQEDL
ncbi:MAG: malto-oligosyltrehalose synthase [Microbacteriaceae bacterium]